MAPVCTCQAVLGGVQFAANVKERLKILGVMHWQMLHALSAAEEVFRDRELPEMEEQAKIMRRQIKVGYRQLRLYQDWPYPRMILLLSHC